MLRSYLLSSIIAHNLVKMSTVPPPNNIPFLLRVVSETVTIVGVAGGIVRNVLQSGIANLGIIDKGINDLQTRADRAAQQYIVSELSKNFPQIVIIGEEPEDSPNESLEGLIHPQKSTQTLREDILSKTVSESIRNIREDELVIWVDPLDGTAEFAKGMVEEVTVLVGIACKGVPVGGVIHQPFYKGSKDEGRTIWGIPGVGCGGLDFKTPPSNERILATTRSHPSPKVTQTLEKLSPTQVLRVGGAGHKIILLLEGRAHAYVYPSPGCKKWDTCAPEAVLRAAGGNLTDFDGTPYNYDKNVEHMNKNGVLATAKGEDHEWYIKGAKLDN